jgi:DNA-binding MurR/RpiR family transcriptional regulator
MICISNTDHNTIAKLSDITLPYFITQHRTPGNSGKAADYVDFTSQVPAVTLAELLAKRLARRLDEE